MVEDVRPADGKPTVLVAGATGTAGTAFVNELAGADYRVFGTVRPGSDPSTITESGATPVEIDLGNVEDTHEAVSAVDAVFVALLGRGEQAAEDEREITENVIDAAQAGSVEQVVYTSVHGADERTGVPHFEVKGELEAYLEASGLPYTILRPTTFMDALSAPWLRRGIEERGVLASPIGEDAPIAYLDTANLATVGRLALETGELQDATLAIGGPEAVTYRELLPVFRTLAGSEVTYQRLPIEQVEADMGSDVASMVRFLNEDGFLVENGPVLDRLDVRLTDVETYLRSTRTAGSEPT